MLRHFVSIDRRDRATAPYDEPDRYRDVARCLDAKGPLIARGAGLSYVGASFGDGVRSIGMGRFCRLLAFDAGARRVTVEAGLGIGRLQAFLAGHGLTLPVQPGHPDITVGGCVACNVHGKNQFTEGTFRRWVRELTVLDADGEKRLSPGDPLFDLTIGGFGLTGIILSVELELRPLRGTAIRQTLHPVGSLTETAARLLEWRDSTDLLYSWNDLTSGTAWGSGFVVAGRYLTDGRVPAPLRSACLDPTRPHPLRRARVMRPGTMPWINRLYRFLEERQPERTLDLFDFMYPAATKGIYFQMYGEDFGMVEHQVLVPHGVWSDYAAELERLARRHRAPIPLTAMKLFGGEGEWVDFTGEGVSLCLDVLPEPEGLAFLDDLDALDATCGVKTALYKDSRLRAGQARRQYPRLEAMAAALGAGSGDRRFASTLSRRLEL